MIISKYGVELRRISHADIELIRQMRNRDDVKRYMFEQQLINSAQQEKWFASINNSNNYYFMVSFEKKEVGLIYGKNLNFEARECEGGVFFWESDVMGTDIPARASICLTEFAFFFFLIEKIYARVRSDNIRALTYNKALGYKPAFGKGTDYFVLSREEYDKRAGYLRRLVGASEGSLLTCNDIVFLRDELQSPIYDGVPVNIRRLLMRYS